METKRHLLRSPIFGILLVQIGLFGIGAIQYAFFHNSRFLIGWFGISTAISLVTGLWIQRKDFSPLLHLSQKGKKLAEKELHRLTRGIAELGMGNFTIRLFPEIDSFNQEKSLFQEFSKVLNAIGEEVQRAAIEFNELTFEPCLRLCYVGTDSFLEGRICGERLGEAIAGKGQVAICIGKLEAANLALRRKGFMASVEEKYPEIEIVAVYESQLNPEIAYERTLDILKKYPKLAGIYVTEAGSPKGVARAVVQAKKAHKVKIVGHDVLKDNMRYVKEGIITATLSQDPFAQGYDPMIHLFNHIVAGWEPPTVRLLTHMEMVDKTNYYRFWDPVTETILEDKSHLAKPVDKIPSKPLRLVYLGKEGFEFWEVVKNGVLSAKETLQAYNTTVEWRLPSSPLVKGDYPLEVYQKEIETLIQEGVDGFAFPCNRSDLIPLINKAVKMGIPVVLSNSEPFNLRSLLYLIHHQATKLARLSENLATSAVKVSTATTQIFSSIDQITTGIVSQDEELHQTENELESLAGHIGQMHWEASRSVKDAESTVDHMEASTQALTESMSNFENIIQSAENTWQIVSELGKTSAQIDHIVQWIEDIASKVNVLALNAQIEAAHAKEHSKGFWVVANEIRTLAKSTASATEEISGLIQEIKTKIQNAEKVVYEGIEKVKESGTVITEAKKDLLTIKNTLELNQKRMTRIAEAVTEVQKASQRVNEAMRHVAQVSSQNTESLKEIHNAVEILNTQFKDVADSAQLMESMSRGELNLLAKFNLKPEN